MRVISPVEITSDTPFSRASTATYFDSNGILQAAGVDVVRVNYDPTTLEPEGILIEDSATNIILRSQELDNAAWTKTNLTVTADATIAPDGTLTADLVTENLVNSNHQLQQSITYTTGSRYCFSAYIKPSGRTKFELQINSGPFTGSTGAAFDLTTLTATTAGSTFSANIRQLPNGWYQIWIITSVATATAATGTLIQLANPTESYTGDGSSGAYIWGVEVKAENEISSYIPTVATAVTRAADMLGNMLTSTVSEPDVSAGEALWNAATNYSLNQEVIRTTTHKKYINIQAGVDATLPEVDAALDNPTRWIESGSTNRFAMFDTLRNTQTETTSPLSVVIGAGQRINSIGVLAMEAEEITITVSNGYEQIYSYTQDLNTREVLDWYDFFFEPFSNIPSIVKFDLPPYTAGNITVTLKSSTGTVKCGAVILGNYTDIGKLQYGARISANNFSRIDREFDGTAVLVQRQTKPKISGQLFFDKSQTNRILALKESLNAVPAVWSGLDDDSTDDYFDGFLVLGIYKLFDVDVRYPEKALLDLEIEEI